MRKTLIALIFGLFSLINISFAANYTIEKYDVDMQLQSDGSMHVQETINVDFSSPSRGIIKKIATKNPKDRRVTSISNARVQSDSFTTDTDGDYVSLKIWDPDQTILWDHQYKISYTVDNAIVSFDNNSWEELYWNVVWTEWNTSIDEVTFSLTLPKEYQSNGDQYYAVRGKKGEKRKENLSFDKVWTRVFQWVFTGVLSAWEGITMYIPFPGKYFTFPEHYNDYFRTNFKFPSLSQLFWILLPIVAVLIFISIIRAFIAFIYLIRKNRKEFKEMVLANEDPKESWETNSGAKHIATLKKYIFLLWILQFLLLFFLSLFLEDYWRILICTFWGNLLIFLFFFLLERFFKYKGKKPIIPYYLPPKNLDPLSLFAFADNNGLANWVMTPLLYYRASKKWIKIRYTNQYSGQSYFSIIPDKEYKEKIGLWIFNTLFAEKNELIIERSRNNSLYSKITKLNCQFQKLYETEEKNLWWSQKKIILKYFYIYTLSEKWKALYDELNGFKYYLEKVERPQIELILKEDPEYISKILPRVALFGLNDKLSKKIWDIVEIHTHEWFEGTSSLEWLTILSELNSSISSNEHTPYSGSGRSSSSDFWSGWWSSWSGWGWSSWGWGWGWGGSSR